MSWRAYLIIQAACLRVEVPVAPYLVTWDAKDVDMVAPANITAQHSTQHSHPGRSQLVWKTHHTVTTQGAHSSQDCRTLQRLMSYECIGTCVLTLPMCPAAWGMPAGSASLPHSHTRTAQACDATAPITGLVASVRLFLNHLDSQAM